MKEGGEKVPLLQRINNKLPHRFRKKDVEADLKDPSKFRTVVPLHAQHAQGNDKQPFANNTVTTSKYTLISFIPKNLWEQFHRTFPINLNVICVANVLLRSVVINPF